MSTTDPHIEALFSSELTTTEKMLWTGQPDSSKIFMRADWWLSIISAVTLGVAVILLLLIAANLEKLASDLGRAIFIGVIASLLLAFGLFTGFFRYWVKRWCKRRMYYAITNRRALFLKQRPNRDLVAGPLEDFPTMRREVRRDGSGHLLFGAPNARFNKLGNTGMDFGGLFDARGIALYDIPDVAEVFCLAERARQERFELLAARG